MTTGLPSRTHVEYDILTGLNARYTFETYRSESSYAMVSDARIRDNSREWKVGNPNLQPSRVIKNIIDVSYNGRRVSCGIEYGVPTCPWEQYECV